MSWTTELAKVENDTLRTTGDVSGIISKYSAPDGPRTWRDAPFGEFVSIVGDQWMKDLTDAQRNALLNTHTDVSGNVTLSNGPTRTAIAPLLDAQQTTQMQAGFSTQQTLWQTLGLPAPAPTALSQAMTALTDTPQYDSYQRHVVWGEIRDRVKQLGNLADTLSLTDLNTIKTIIGA
jgi:hypothetical protein